MPLKYETRITLEAWPIPATANNHPTTLDRCGRPGCPKPALHRIQAVRTHPNHRTSDTAGLLLCDLHLAQLLTDIVEQLTT